MQCWDTWESQVPNSCSDGFGWQMGLVCLCESGHHGEASVPCLVPDTCASGARPAGQERRKPGDRDISDQRFVTCKGKNPCVSEMCPRVIITSRPSARDTVFGVRQWTVPPVPRAVCHLPPSPIYSYAYILLTSLLSVLLLLK